MNGITAKLVWDGAGEVYIPAELGTPRDDQMQGTAAEQLGEICGRVCYDSLGTGRPSFDDRIVTGVDPHTGEQLVEERQGYHSHILQVGHGSVYEHYHATLEISYGHTAESVDRAMKLVWLCANRPGVLVLPALHDNFSRPRSLRITVNPRAVLEWANWTKSFYGRTDSDDVETMLLWKLLLEFGGTLAPHIFCMMPPVTQFDVWTEIRQARIVKPISEHEMWVSLFMQGSRGFSHEQVRHGDFTAISQRSTRFCDESSSPWVEHPLIAAWREDREAREAGIHRSFLGVPLGYLLDTEDSARRDYNLDTIDVARMQYDRCVATLQPWLEARGVDKTSARKQARGAARGFLGNALQTEMIFSASVAQWKVMLGQRASQFADAEIREVYASEAPCVLSALKGSRYGNCFDNYRLTDSPDGIGHIAVAG